jgi:hypothetical protein
MHSTRIKKKSGARKSELSGKKPECSGNLDTPGKFLDLGAFRTPVKNNIHQRFSI